MLAIMWKLLRDMYELYVVLQNYYIVQHKRLIYMYTHQLLSNFQQMLYLAFFFLPSSLKHVHCTVPISRVTSIHESHTI